MSEIRTEPAPGAVLQRLLAARGLQFADGRPLHRYRFTRAEYEDLVARLRGRGPRGLASDDGAALFVAFASEWFRRDRDGGHWDWIRPLRAIGIAYGSRDAEADLTYPEIRSAVACGLRGWRRPEPADREWVLAVVGEAGFPAAATRMDPRMATWLKRSVLAIERGFSPREAVEIEAWRVSQRIVRALLPAAVDLCTAVVDLRASIPGSERTADPVAVLDETRPNWRETLPFDLELRDVAALVREVLRADEESSAALTVSRHLVREGSEWRARAELTLSGFVPHARMPSPLREHLERMGRLRLVGRGDLADVAAPFAALERDRDGGRDAWEVRPLVAHFDRRLLLESDLRLGVLVGDRIAGEFTAFGGEGAIDGVVVLEPVGDGEPSMAAELAVLGLGSVQRRAQWLAVAATPALLSEVKFETRLGDIGAVSGGERRVVAFTGQATLDLESVRRTWRANATVERSTRMTLSGETLRSAREQVFLGPPTVWFEDGRAAVSPRSSTLRWRPRGGGPWRTFEAVPPVGRIDIGLFADGAVVDSVTAGVAPVGLALRGRAKPRSLVIKGLGAVRVAARGAGPLPIASLEDCAVVDLEGLTPGGRLTLELQGDSRLDITLDDPSAMQVLLTPSQRIAPRRTRLAVARLHGYRLLAASAARICFDLRVANRSRGQFIRIIEGVVPLPAFEEEIRALLAGADGLDAEVRLSWLGGDDRIADVGWYERVERVWDTTGAAAPRRGAFALLRPLAGALDDAPAATDPHAAEILRAALGPGPWLVHATEDEGEILRPRLVRDTRTSASGPLASAVEVRVQADRSAAFDALLRGPHGSDTEVLRSLIDLLVTAARRGLPLTSLDGATALCRTPEAAVRVLAYCDTLEERRAVLALQRDLSFLWCATPLSVWLDAIRTRRTELSERLAGVGIGAGEALRYMAAGLAEISDLKPGMVAHTRLVFLLELHDAIAAERSPLDAGLARRLMRGVPADDSNHFLRTLASDLLARHADGDLPPRNLRLAGLVREGLEIVADINPRFADIAAAPFVAAALAAGTADPDHTLRARCREAWLFDPEYFERASALALNRLAGADRTTEARP
jgi:hypothetical protein